jgi:hypothetical protein
MPQRDAEGHFIPEGKLWDLCSRIGEGRREGKNRRDGATVRSRVLTLTGVVGKDLFEEAFAEANGVPTTKKSRRRKGIQTRAQL